MNDSYSPTVVSLKLTPRDHHLSKQSIQYLPFGEPGLPHSLLLWSMGNGEVKPAEWLAMKLAHVTTFIYGTRQPKQRSFPWPSARAKGKRRSPTYDPECNDCNYRRPTGGHLSPIQEQSPATKESTWRREAIQCSRKLRKQYHSTSQLPGK